MSGNASTHLVPGSCHIGPPAMPPSCLISLNPFSISLPNCLVPGMSCFLFWPDLPLQSPPPHTLASLRSSLTIVCDEQTQEIRPLLFSWQPVLALSLGFLSSSIFQYSSVVLSTVDSIGHDWSLLRTQTQDKEPDLLIGYLELVCATEVCSGEACNNLRSFFQGEYSM